jgi:GNAT superfamily N-acetyltransferase
MTAASRSVLLEMQKRASNLWRIGRRWTPGEIAWSVLTNPSEPDVIFLEDGWAWKQEGCTSILTSNLKAAGMAIDWADESDIDVIDGDLILDAAVRNAGYGEVPSAPFSLDVRMSTSRAPAPILPHGYVVRSAAKDDDLVSIHRASWQPRHLPFAKDHRPAINSGATSTFTRDHLAAIQSAWTYRGDLHLVVETPDSSLVASCIIWFDEPNRTAAIEPLGVHPDHRRRGIAGALTLRAVAAIRDVGGREVVIHPRGDPAYPAARGAYFRVGFASVDRTRLFARR